MCESQKVGPELRLCDHNQFRAECFQVWTDGEGKVEWEIENVAGPKTFTREFLSGKRSGRKHNAMIRVVLAQLTQQSADGKHFAHRDGVYPDYGLALVFEQARRNASKALAKSGTIFAAAEHLDDPP